MFMLVVCLCVLVCMHVCVCFPSLCFPGVVDGSEPDLSALQMQHPTEGVSELGELVQFLLLSLPKLWAEEMVQGEPDPVCWGSASL